MVKISIYQPKNKFIMLKSNWWYCGEFFNWKENSKTKKR